MDKDIADVELESAASPMQLIADRGVQCQNRHTAIFRASLYSTTPISPSETYKKGVSKERRYFIMMEMVVAVVGPVVFRYVIAAAAEEDTNTNYFERFVLFVMFLDIISWLFKGLPMLSGSPTDVTSSMSCSVEGKVVLGCCSPFVAEDEAIFFRSLLGRSCTAFSTCTSRHNIRGLYVDTILNEKRFPGEENRRNMWFAWQKFLSSLVDICESRATKERDNTTMNEDCVSSMRQSETFRRSSVMRNMRLSSIFQAPIMYTQFLESSQVDTTTIIEESAEEGTNDFVYTPTESDGNGISDGPIKRSRLSSLFSKDKFAPQPEEGENGTHPSPAHSETTASSKMHKRTSGVSMAKRGSAVNVGAASTRKKSRMASLYATNPMDMYTIDTESILDESNVDRIVNSKDDDNRISWKKSTSGEYGAKKQVLYPPLASEYLWISSAILMLDVKPTL